MMRPDVPDAPPAELAPARIARVLAGAAVIPAARAADLPSELHERDVERRLHQPYSPSRRIERAAATCSASPLCDATEIACCSLVVRARNPSRRLHCDRLGHRASVDLDVPAEGVEEVLPRHRRDRCRGSCSPRRRSGGTRPAAAVRHGPGEVGGGGLVDVVCSWLVVIVMFLESSSRKSSSRREVSVPLTTRRLEDSRLNSSATRSIKSRMFFMTRFES